MNTEVRMVTVKTLAEAISYFKPFNPHRESETVVIGNMCPVEFMHWDKAKGEFHVETDYDKWGFKGWMIDGITESRLPPGEAR